MIGERMFRKKTRSYGVSILVGRVCIFGSLLLGALFVWSTQLDAGRVVARSEDSRGWSVEMLSPAYQLDRVYMSMQGPRSNQAKIQLSPAAAPDDTLWLTGVETKIVDAKSLKPISNEFFCHSNLTLNPDTTTPQQHNGSFDRRTHTDWRLFTLVPGRMTVQLPEGFGLPVKNSTLLDYYTMALNQNAGQPDRSVRMHTQITYRHNLPGERAVRPLFRRALYVYQQHSEESGADAVSDESEGQHLGELCAEGCPIDQRGRTPSRFGDALASHPGATCCVSNASTVGVVPQFGEENTVHWMVPPGSHEYHTEVTEQMQLPFDTTSHYVTGHLHPFGKALRLVDLKTGEVVFEITARSYNNLLGVEWMSELRSPEGVPIHRGRRYELIAEYENTLDRPIDAMGILYLYALDEAP